MQDQADDSFSPLSNGDAPVPVETEVVLERLQPAADLPPRRRTALEPGPVLPQPLPGGRLPVPRGAGAVAFGAIRGGTVLCFLGIWLLAAFNPTFQTNTIARRIGSLLGDQMPPASEPIPLPIFRAIVLELQSRLPVAKTAKGIAGFVFRIWEKMHVQPPSAVATVSLLLVYLLAAMLIPCRPEQPIRPGPVDRRRLTTALRVIGLLIVDRLLWRSAAPAAAETGKIERQQPPPAAAPWHGGAWRLEVVPHRGDACSSAWRLSSDPDRRLAPWRTRRRPSSPRRRRPAAETPAAQNRDKEKQQTHDYASLEENSAVKYPKA